MKVLKITDNPDGSAILDLEMSEKEQKFLIQYAVVDLLKKYIESKSMDDLIKEREKKVIQ